MTTSTLVAGGLILVGAIGSAPGLVLLGVFALATTWLSTVWSRRGLDRVRYERLLSRDRAVWGDRVDLVISIENAKALPLAWLRADDLATPELTITSTPLVTSDRPGFVMLRNTWSLAPYEAVRRVFHIEADRRGLYRFDSVRLSVADIFGRGVARREDPRPATLLVRPRSVPVSSRTGTVVLFGTRRTIRGLVEDPSLFAGVRPFQRGDPRRRVHERATARVGRPVSRRLEPSTARQVVIAVDIQTHEGPAWLLEYDEETVESLAVAAASLARRLLADGAACGLAVNAWTYSIERTGFVPPRPGHDQLPRIADMLARVSSTASISFEHVLGSIPLRAPTGTLVVTLSSRDPTRFIPALRRLRSTGFEVRHVAIGARASTAASIASRAGIDAVVGRLEPDWRTCRAFALDG